MNKIECVENSKNLCILKTTNHEYSFNYSPDQKSLETFNAFADWCDSHKHFEVASVNNMSNTYFRIDLVCGDFYLLRTLNELERQLNELIVKEVSR